MTMLIGIIGVVFAFGLVIFLHEFGHFIVAKKIGVRVERFSFGLGPEIFGIKYGETRYCLSWVPLGGEVRMAGEFLDENDESRAFDPREFFAQPWYKRIPIVVAGPMMNYASAIVLFSLIVFLWGLPKVSTEAMIGGIISGFPADKAGLKAGDKLLKINNEGIDDWEELSEIIHVSAGKKLKLYYLRDGEKLSVDIIPKEGDIQGMGLIGITPYVETVKAGFFRSFTAGTKQTFRWTAFTLIYLAEKIGKREKPDIAGPIGIASIAAKAAQAGMQDFIYLIALLSVGVAIFNLFPIPLLDGGHLVFYLWEGITKRPVKFRAMQIANTVGLSLLIAIFVFATYNDIQRFFGKSKAGVNSSISAENGKK